MTVSSSLNFKRVSFLAQGLLEEGVFAFITGAPGATKTLVSIELAARLTRGKMPGDLTGTPINVLYISIESDFSRSTGPRFAAADGDFARFKQIEEVVWLPKDINRLEEMIRTAKAKLVIIDPIKDHLEQSVYSSPTRTTQALRQLHQVAVRTNCTILGVDWPSKSTRKGDMSVSGNAAFTGVPRQVLAVGRLSREEWVVGVTKANDSPALTGWIYSVDAKELSVIVGGKPLVSRKITWQRTAKPNEVLRALEQAQIEEDPNLLGLLEFVSGDDEWFKTEDLVGWLNNVRLLGKNKARALLHAAKEAGFMQQRAGGAGAEFSVTWAIAPVGRLRLAMNAEANEEAIETLFPTMDPNPMEINGRRLLSNPKPKQRKRIIRQGAPDV